MKIDFVANVKYGKRLLSTECVFCHTWANVCPRDVLDVTFKCDIGWKELIPRRQAVNEAWPDAPGIWREAGWTDRNRPKGGASESDARKGAMQRMRNLQRSLPVQCH